MATHDYVIANASGAAVRADLNNALAAIVTNNSSATEPATTYPYMLWADTTAGQLKLRNGTNDAWIVLQELDGTLLMKDGTVAAPGLAFASDIDTGFYRPAADQLAAVTNGVERVKYGTTEVVFNDGAEDYDFRIEGATVPSLIATNAGDDTISFGGNITSDTVYDGDVQMASQNGGPLAGFRNQIINGDFRIWQRGTAGYFNASGTINYESVDRWGIQDLTAGNHLAQSGNVPVGFDYSATIDSQTNATIRHRIELYDNKPGPFVSGSQWTLSVWANNQIRARVQDSNANTSLAMGDMTATSETSNGFTRYAETFTLSANASGDYLEVALQNQNGVLMRVTGCQLEAGPVATPLEIRPIQTELALCQRYYFQLPAGVLVPTYNPTQDATVETDTGRRVGYVNHPVLMRAIPTVTGDLAGATATLSDASVYGCQVSAGSQGSNKFRAINAYTADAEL